MMRILSHSRRKRLIDFQLIDNLRTDIHLLVVDGTDEERMTHDDHRNPEIEEIALQAKSVYHRLKSAGAPEELVAKAEALADTIERYQAD